MAVVFTWHYLFPPAEPLPPPATELPDSDGSQALPPPASGVGDSGPETGEATPEATPEDGEGAAEVAAPTGEQIAANYEEHPTLETGDAILEFTNRGAQLLSYRLKEHKSSTGDLLNLVRVRTAGPYPFALVDSAGNPLPVDDGLFAVERTGSGEGETLTFHYRGPEGEAEKRFHVREDGLLEVEVDVRGLSRGWAIFLGPGVRNPPAKEIKSRFEVRSAVYLVGGKLQRTGAKGASQTITLDGAGLAWAGLDDTYFLTAILPTTPLAQVSYRPLVVQPEGEGGEAAESEGEGAVASRFIPVPADGEVPEALEDLPREYALLLRPEGSHFAATAFWGAKQYERLVKLPGGLEQTVDLGWFKVLALPLMFALRWIYQNVVGNYGWAIVLMTIGIKLILLPLTHKSMVSMRKMQELNPKMQAIRAKYAGKLKDKQGRPNLEAQRKMNEEIMGLYRAEGVNPAGGCLPMVLQIPVFFAFYKLLYVSVELRGAPWIPGVEDLTAPEPILAIIMGATQFLQQRMMPATGNEMQRRIMMLMPIFFTVLFIGFPSGLVLYWLTNNLLSIAQQYFYNRSRDQAAVVAGAGQESKGKKPGKAKAEDR